MSDMEPRKKSERPLQIFTGTGRCYLQSKRVQIAAVSPLGDGRRVQRCSVAQVRNFRAA